MTSNFMYAEPIAFEDPEETTGTDLQVKTMNANLGAIRVAVPRHMGKVIIAVDQMAQTFGHGWLYRLPFKNKKTGETEFVEGPTIGCALDIARCYGNNSVEVDEVVEEKDGWVFHAVFLDIETGFRLRRPFRQRKNQNIGGMGGDAGRVEDTLFQIGASKALRNVVRNALRGLVDEALRRAARRLTARIENDRDAALLHIRERLEEEAIPETRVTKYFGDKLEKLQPDKLAQIIKMLLALKDKVIEPDEFCPEAVDAVDLVEETIEDSPLTNTKSRAKRAPRITLKFRGKDIAKTNFIRDVRQLASRCDSLSDLAELHKDANDALKGLPEKTGLAIAEEIAPHFETAQAQLQGHDEDGVVTESTNKGEPIDLSDLD